MRRLLLIPLGILLALVGIELTLRVGAAVVQWSGRPRPALGAAANETILCVGDSNTYGLYLEERESYPAQLQQLLGDRVRVVNLGFPGMNSSRLLADLPTMLEATQPAIVLILIGVNDFWTAPEPVHGTQESWSARLSRWSRAYRLLYMVARDLVGTPIVSMPRMSTQDLVHAVGTARGLIGGESVDLSWGPATPGQQWEGGFHENVFRIIDTIDSHGARPVFLTYPSNAPVYRAVSAEILQDVPPSAAQVIDLQARVAALCTTQDCGPLFFGDGHPTAAGYAAVAATVADTLR